MTFVCFFLGSNTIPSEFHYEPADPSNTVAQSLLSEYLETSGAVRAPFPLLICQIVLTRRSADTFDGAGGYFVLSLRLPSRGRERHHA